MFCIYVLGCFYSVKKNKERGHILQGLRVKEQTTPHPLASPGETLREPDSANCDSEGTTAGAEVA